MKKHIAGKMKQIIDFLKLIRWPNLLIVLVSMVFIQLLVIEPIFRFPLFTAGMNLFQFILLIIATLSITIGGYMINDFFDMQADGVNKPGENQVGKKFSVARTQLFYWIFTIFGSLAGTYLSWMTGHLTYALIFILTAGALWFYSERYQCMPLVGNVLVAFLSALSFGLVWLYNFVALTNNPPAFAAVQSMFPLINHFVLMYMGFAFIVNLMREIVKDIEDIEGDNRFGCRTFAVVFGQQKSKIVAISVAIIGIIFTVWFQVLFLAVEFYTFFGYFVLIDLLFVVSIIWLIQAKKKSDFKRISFFMKLIMLIGIFSMFLVYFEL